MTTTIDDSLTLGLRALATLARDGPRDVPALAGLHHSQVRHIAAVMAELERDGLVHRLTDQPLFTVTRRGAALFDDAPSGLH